MAAFPQPQRGHGVQQHDVAAVRAFFDAFARMDVETVVALCDPAVSFQPASTEMAERPAYIGPAGIRQYLTDVRETWERFRLTIHSIHAGDGAVVALGRIYAATGGFVGDDPVGIVCIVRDGKLLYGKVYTNQDIALGAAGIDARR